MWCVGRDRFDELVEQNHRLVAENESLRAENSSLRAENLLLRSQVEALTVVVAKLEATVARLQADAGSNSGNSSKPPSRDPAVERERQARARREAKRAAAGGESRSRGGQAGAKGVTRALSDDPDAVVDHRPQQCSGCGASLAGLAPVGDPARRQVIDVPRPAPVVTEHRAHTVCCAGCATANTARFPAGVSAPVQFGPMVHSLVVYLLARQHLPVERCAEAIRDLCGVEISTGTIDAMYSRASKRLAGYLVALKALLVSLPV